MSPRWIYSAATLLICWAMPAPAAAQSADAIQSALEAAALHLAQGEPAAARDALRPVEAAEPHNPWLWFYRGTASLLLGEPYQAIADYDRGLEELAALGDPDPDLAERISDHRHRARRQVFRLSFQTGLAYDTNVSYLGRAAAGPGQITGRSDGKFTTDFRLDYAPIATARDVLALGARLGHSWHFSIDEFDLQDYGASIRYARRLDPQWEVALQYDYDFTLLGRDPFLSNHVLTPSVAYHWLPGPARFGLDRTRVYYRFEARDFLFPVHRAFDRDGFVNGGGIEQSFRFRPLPDQAWTWDLSLGYAFEYVSTQGREFDRLGHILHAGASIPLIHPARPDQYLLIPDLPLIFRFSARWDMDRYRNPSLIDQRRRRRSDTITTLNFGLSQTLMQSRDHGDLVLHGLISWMDANSNVTTLPPGRRYGRVSPFTYDKVLYGLQLEWTW